jgi:hypothetical protein
LRSRFKGVTFVTLAIRIEFIYILST